MCTFARIHVFGNKVRTTKPAEKRFRNLSFFAAAQRGSIERQGK